MMDSQHIQFKCLKESGIEDLIELETGQNLLVRPPKSMMLDVVEGNYFGYVRPVYQHYNWCINYLGVDKSFITWETSTRKLSRENTEQITDIMTEACKKYLQENIEDGC